MSIQQGPKLLLQPIHNSSADIIKTFALGKPLTPDQLHFLEWNEKKLSNAALDPVLDYYLKKQIQNRKFQTSFLVPHEEMNYDAIELLKKRLKLSLKNKSEHAVIQLNHAQFLNFKQYTTRDLIFWHGNQFLTGAPFFPGGIPPVIYFQWGNLFGVAKYIILPGEKALKGNLLIYFENMEERNLDECVHEYEFTLQHQIKQQHDIIVANQNVITPSETPYKSPTLSLSNYFLIHRY